MGSKGYRSAHSHRRRCPTIVARLQCVRAVTRGVLVPSSDRLTRTSQRLAQRGVAPLQRSPSLTPRPTKSFETHSGDLPEHQRRFYNRTTSVCPFCDAICTEFRQSQPLAWISAPCSIRKRTASSSPRLDARYSDVFWFLFRTSTEIPRSSRNFAM